eukprot:TRINITY_DN10030_c0_g1_i1.p1 TRINITY_DN10030_c0_g1~~TRINITY_DN10030_c0_g1_i1.p1  ORF type:complete len:150 (+),score=41.57 TRINITY_DN10030_c0_g1_i1:18-467(+)
MRYRKKLLLRAYQAGIHKTHRHRSQGYLEQQLDDLFDEEEEKQLTQAKNNSKNNEVSKENPPKTNQTAQDSIDDIFSMKPKKSTPSTAPKKSPKGPSKNGGDDIWSDSRGDKKGRKTVDGVKVYTYDELSISSNSGGTPLCPFDCKCCF